MLNTLYALTVIKFSERNVHLVRLLLVENTRSREWRAIGTTHILKWDYITR